jgi:hypothetical protein
MVTTIAGIRSPVSFVNAPITIGMSRGSDHGHEPVSRRTNLPSIQATTVIVIMGTTCRARVLSPNT